uniref:PiggyBac transposable element-derived protein domain-containing protein n=1 Tax=Neogobius melanostomus TaxID=47308 RepID=A0A8C6SQI7_9GOBI
YQQGPLPKRPTRASASAKAMYCTSGEEDEDDEEDYQPPLQKSALASKGLTSGKEEEDTPPTVPHFVPAREPGPVLDKTKSWSVLELFQLFFSPTVINTIVKNTNLNADNQKRAGKKYPWNPLNIKEFYVFLAILIYTGLVSMHERSDYWKRSFPYGHPFPGNTMTRVRFETIVWTLHLSDPAEDEENDKKRNTQDYDRLFKIKPLYLQIVTACKAFFQPYQNISIDERMVSSKARISIKQYHRDKPTKWGYKLYVLADSSTGYTWNFFVYSGKTVTPSEHGLSYSSVMDLMPFGLLGRGYKLYVDNFYTSPLLFLDLSAKNTGACGTIRKTRSGFPLTVQNDLPKKAQRGEVRWLREDKLLFLKWMDKREVTLCSSMHKAYSGKTIKRKVKEQGVWQTTQVPCPDAVVDYNKWMGGVDLSDALLKYYRVQQKTMKWYKTFFYHFVDVAIVNSYIIHKKLVKGKADGTKALTQKEFREQLVKEMLMHATDFLPSTSEAATTVPRVCTKVKAPSSLFMVLVPR